MQRVVPVIPVEDYERSRSFWVDALDFEVDWEWRDEPGLPVFAQISRAGLSLYLAQRSGEAAAPCTTYVYVSDVDAWHQEALEAGLAVEAPPQDRPWGNREMSLRDPDGNALVVASVLPARPA